MTTFTEAIQFGFSIWALALQNAGPLRALGITLGLLSPFLVPFLIVTALVFIGYRIAQRGGK